MGRADLMDDPRFKTAAGRLAHWDERLEMMQEVFATKTTAEWIEILDRAEVPCAPINRRADLLVDPQIRANKLVVEDEHPHAGPIRQTRPAARFDRTPASMRGRHSDREGV